MHRTFVLRLPRRLIFLGMSIVYLAIVAESATASGPPPRFPDLFPVWFWLPATVVTLAVSLIAAALPTLSNVRLATVFGIVWCSARAMYNLLAGHLPFPALIGFAVWVGFVLILFAVGMAGATTGPITDAQRTGNG